MICTHTTATISVFNIIGTGNHFFFHTENCSSAAITQFCDLIRCVLPSLKHINDLSVQLPVLLLSFVLLSLFSYSDPLIATGYDHTPLKFCNSSAISIKTNKWAKLCWFNTESLAEVMALAFQSLDFLTSRVAFSPGSMNSVGQYFLPTKGRNKRVFFWGVSEGNHEKNASF